MITPDNVEAALRIRVRPEQQRHVGPVAVSLPPGQSTPRAVRFPSRAPRDSCASGTGVAAPRDRGLRGRQEAVPDSIPGWARAVASSRAVCAGYAILAAPFPVAFPPPRPSLFPCPDGPTTRPRPAFPAGSRPRAHR
ncbi:hypothetical protein SCWH03_29640 [Streptomyces pacificus]|uniref:Uncharacterized protein n=1 Tax=Streptomyces pacificus TaxID=2705029 RepID=A0A6A0AV32_9ACTN|nr:hypothetical protein SCWH03_29640 [Streptomyces pacificus]